MKIPTGLLPKSALTVEEEAWNAYPYTKTRYTCPFVEKFSLEIETYYFPDDGHQDNVFKLSGSDLRNRIVGELSKIHFRFAVGFEMGQEKWLNSKWHAIGNPSSDN